MVLLSDRLVGCTRALPLREAYYSDSRYVHLLYERLQPAWPKKRGWNSTLDSTHFLYAIWKHGGILKQLEFSQFILWNVSPQPQSTTKSKDPSWSPETATQSSHFLRFLTLSFSDISGSAGVGALIVSRPNLDWRCSMRSLAIRRATHQAQRRFTAAPRPLRSNLTSRWNYHPLATNKKKVPAKSETERNWFIIS